MSLNKDQKQEMNFLKILTPIIKDYMKEKSIRMAVDKKVYY